VVSKEDAFKDFPVGKKVSGQFAIGDVQVPLPEGDWVMAGRGVYAAKTSGNNAGPTMAQVALFDAQNATLRRYIWIQTSLEQGGLSWVKPKDCDRKNVFHVQSEELPQVYSQFCWVINHLRVHFDPKSGGAVAEASQYMRDNSINFPDTMLATIFYMSVGPKYLQIAYSLNPEVDGISPSKNSAWDGNDWHISRLHRFPDKQQYAEKTKAWATEWKEKVKQGFHKKL
jgi:hypothetical protein